MSSFEDRHKTTVIVFESEAFFELQRQQTEMFHKAMVKAHEEAIRAVNPKSVWYRTAKAQEVTGFSRNHLYNLRKKGLVEHKLVDGQIRYNYFSLLDYINNGESESK